MLQLSQSFVNRPVMSLRTGGQVGKTVGVIINPANLKIEGFYCMDEFDHKRIAILLAQDIRDMLPQGMVVDDHDVLTDPEELIRLKGLLDLNFAVIGKPVATVGKTRLGKVSDYSADTITMFIQKIYVSQSIFKSVAGGNLGIDRTQIVEITDAHIVVQDLTERLPAAAKAWA